MMLQRATKVFQLDKAWLRVQQQEKLREANVKIDDEKKEKPPKAAADNLLKVESPTKVGETAKSKQTTTGGGGSTLQNGPPTKTSHDENFSFKLAEQASLTRQSQSKKASDKDTATMPGFTPSTPGRKGTFK